MLVCVKSLSKSEIKRGRNVDLSVLLLRRVLDDVVYSTICVVVIIN